LMPEWSALKSISTEISVGMMRRMRPPHTRHGPTWSLDTFCPHDPQPHQHIIVLPSRNLRVSWRAGWALFLAIVLIPHSSFYEIRCDSFGIDGVCLGSRLRAPLFPVINLCSAAFPRTDIGAAPLTVCK
jgi:hypothetical protein